MVIMRMACDGMCLTGREYDYDCLIIAGMVCTYLLVRRKILRLYRLVMKVWDMDGWWRDIVYGCLSFRCLSVKSRNAYLCNSEVKNFDNGKS